MNTTELMSIFRAEVFDLEEPYLWSDALVNGYIDEAQKQFCRDTYGIADARSFKLNIVPGTSWYKTDPRILKLRNAVDASTGRDIPIVPVEKMEGLGMRFDASTGGVRALISGLEESMLRTWPAPGQPLLAELRTFRLPDDLAAGDDFEIAPHHHRSLLHWVKHLAYSVQDAETYDKSASDSFAAKHAMYCSSAKAEQDRAMRPVGTVAYGGI